jgi:16S rRNA (guanine966-N2)-methyltransferase
MGEERQAAADPDDDATLVSVVAVCVYEAMRKGKKSTGKPKPLRIIGGAFRGSKLHSPSGKDLLRPMRNHVREALFNVLGPLDGEVVLDLFAGTGSLGLEALSRGAERAVFVDKADPCLSVLRKNIAGLGVEDRARVRKHDLGRGVAALLRDGPFDLVLVHPPFVLLRGEPPKPGEPVVSELLGALATTSGLLAPDATIAFETPNRCYPNEGDLPELEVIRRKEYGSTALFVARARGAP